MLKNLSRPKKLLLVFACGIIAFATWRYPDAATAAVTGAFALLMAIMGFAT